MQTYRNVQEQEYTALGHLICFSLFRKFKSSLVVNSAMIYGLICSWDMIWHPSRDPAMKIVDMDNLDDLGYTYLIFIQRITKL